MKKVLTLMLLMLSLNLAAQTKINYWTWYSNHVISSQPEKWNRYDSWNYMPRYYFAPTISFSLKFRYMRPSNYFYYREKKRTYKFIF